MTTDALFNSLFGPGRHTIIIDGAFMHGTAVVAGREAVVIGTRDHAEIDCELALKVAGTLLAAVAEDGNGSRPPRTIVILVDTRGQALSRHDELIGLNGCFAHTAGCADLARRCGHRLVTLVHGDAVSGGFLAFGLMADRICALPHAQVRVMDLRAMARVTKIPYDRLVVLAEESPVFAPGAENYWRMGAVHELWSADDDWCARLEAAVNCAEAGDTRAALGLERDGRRLASPLAQLVAAAS
ncbi:MAG: biotin-independent malonate decarboxylase subunit gamma [Deltaproteobacteria bacterium]|nr:biotin-independent malonate decarboxylase subunit gamma [Deltaproteobacteria bacterium]